MNSSGSSFKAAQSTDVRAGAQDDLDKISMSSSRGAAKKKSAPRTLKPIPGKQSAAQLPKASLASDIIPSGSLQHKQSNRLRGGEGNGETGNVINMGLGPGKSINPLKKQRKEMLKDIDLDVNQFMKEFEEQKSHAIASCNNLTSAADDLLSSVSGVTADSKI